jgi:hypothetical protein
MPELIWDAKYDKEGGPERIDKPVASTHSGVEEGLGGSVERCGWSHSPQSVSCH